MRTHPKKRPELWKNGWLLHCDNAPSHSAVIIWEYLAKNCITLLEHLYSPDLAPCDFFLFPKMKNIMNRQHFRTVEAHQEESSRVLKAISNGGIFGVL